jgi:hypothetical protein
MHRQNGLSIVKFGPECGDDIRFLPDSLISLLEQGWLIPRRANLSRHPVIIGHIEGLQLSILFRLQRRLRLR